MANFFQRFFGRGDKPEVKNETDGSITINRANANGGGGAGYSGSTVTNTTMDFLGDWRSADNWMRLDLWRVRCRSRQLARGNAMYRNFRRAMCHFVLGAQGFHMKVNARTVKALGDTTDDQPDAPANKAIIAMMGDFGKKKNFETRRRMNRAAFDKLILLKLMDDGEVVIRKRYGYDNAYGFAWQMLDADYLDHNLNRIESGYDQDGARVAGPGNITKMGVELDREEKFPVAYWFLARRPNDSFYNYSVPLSQRYIRVPASEVIHLYIQDEDSEQTRGFPWVFAGMINLFRQDKFAEAALVNAQIGASKGFFYEKKYPEGWVPGDAELDDDGHIIDKVAPGTSTELPFGVTAKMVDTRYPDAELKPFMQAMALGMSLTLGTSYATTTGDLSEANFVSSKLGIESENALFWGTQAYLIENWKEPGFDEELYRAMIARKIALPVSKFDKFNQPIFTGNRRSGIQPLEEAKANEVNLNNRIDSPQAIVERSGRDWDDLLEQIAKNESELEDAGVPRAVAGKAVSEETLDKGGSEDAPPSSPAPAKPIKKKTTPNNLITADDVIEFYRQHDPAKR